MAGIERGALFAALRVGGGELGRRWGALLAECRRRFPELKPKAVEDLHVTVAYLGHGWREADLERVRATTRLELPEPPKASLEVVRMGHRQRVVALELRGLPERIAAEVIQAKARLVALGLKRPEAQDGLFRPHVTLAERRGEPGGRALPAFAEWVGASLDLPSLVLDLGPATPQVLLLAGATRPLPGPDYLDVEVFLQQVSGR